MYFIVGDSSIAKAHKIVFSTSDVVIAYNGGTVLEGHDKSQAVTIYTGIREHNRTFPFADSVVDFVLQVNKQTDESK